MYTERKNNEKMSNEKSTTLDYKNVVDELQPIY